MDLLDVIASFVIITFVGLSLGGVLYAFARPVAERALDWLARRTGIGRRAGRGAVPRFDLLLVGGSLSFLHRRLPRQATLKPDKGLVHRAMLKPYKGLVHRAMLKPYKGLVHRAMHTFELKAKPGPLRFETRERRRHRRIRTNFLGTLHPSADARADNLCDVLDISASGARIRPVDRLRDASPLTLGLERFGRVPARVVWDRGGEVGLQFEQTPDQTVRMMRGLLPMPEQAH